MTTTNMSLNEPSVGVATGPDWATQVNENFQTIDTHDHTSGKGVQLTPSALNINADLEFNSNAAIELKRVTFDSGATGSGTNYSVYQSGGNLYWYNGSGQAVQITNGASVKTTGGSIDGMSGTDAQVLFGSGIYRFEFDTTKTPFTGSKMAHGDILLYKYDGSSGSDAYVILKYTGSSAGSNNITVPDETGTMLTTSTSFGGNISISATGGSNTITLDAEGDINLDSNSGVLTFKDNGTAIGKISNSSSDLVIECEVDAKDIIFKQYDGNEVVRMADDRRLYFFDKGGEYIVGDGTDLTIASSGEINVNSGTLDLSAQTVDVTLNNAVDALNFDSNTLSIDASNNRIGLGTAAPGTLLHLESAQNAQLKLVNTDVGYSPQIILQGKTNSADNFLGQIIGNWDDDSSPVAKIVFESGADTSNKDDGMITFWTSDASDTPDERMRIDQNGNVGIGKTANTYLDVLNTAQVTGGEGISASLYLVADEGDDNGDGWRINSNHDVNDLTISNNASGSYVDKVTLDTNGNMSVTGTINGTEIHVTATNNLGVGLNALDSITSTSGTYNVAVGDEALTAVTIGDNNTAIGYSTGLSLITGSNNTLIGRGSSTTATDSVYSIVLGAADCQSIGNYNITMGIGTGSNRISNEYVTNATWTHASDVRIKKEIQTNTDCGLNFINDLRTVTFKRKAPSEMDATMSEYDPEVTNALCEHKLYGFIAQEVKQALDDNNITDFGGWNQQKDGDNLQGISYEMFVIPLVKAIQELSGKVTALESA